MLRRRDLRFVRRQAILQGRLRPPDVDIEEVVDALRQEVLRLRARLPEARAGEDREPLGARHG
jgi:hypothetical protein